MPYQHIVTPEKLEEIRSECEERDDHNTEAILDKYVTPDEAIGMVVTHHTHGYATPMCEVASVDVDEELVTLERLFDPDTTHEIPMDKPLDTPFIGKEYTVSWIEARVDGEWERVSDVSCLGDWRGPHTHGEEYDETRVVEKTYKHGADQYDEWPIRVARQSDEPEVVIEREDFQNPEVLDTVFDQITLPDDFDVGGLVVGEIYTEQHIVETEDGGHEKQHEIVWYSVKAQFRPGHRGYTSPVNGIDRSPA
jgi:hypothetical protein